MLYSLPAILDLMLSHYQLMKKQDGSGFYTVEDVFTAYEITKFLQHSKQVDLKMVHDKIVAFFHLVNNDVLKNDKKLTPLKPLYKLYDGSLTYEQVKDKDGTLLELKGWSE
ncbi:hypothetical protein I6F10_05035 [Pseudoalteromonas sp. SWYJZ98]|uniref:hypothetical protein n=2 Tax=unclassified Pseudoalteromonas TaxID=194690 RepID=UPI0018CE22EE|nr:hypothetical protein [Pseudoalteromonas sp. SWYJZ98]MBH0030277.1 hypothetical protein [Pseudoalteromonas sp. SWYJZ98]